MTNLLTDEVRLVPATVDLLELEDVSGTELATALGVAPPPSWPPLYNGPETRKWVRDHLAAEPASLWYTWYIIADVDGQPTLAGIGGYKGPPTNEGTVEIGFSIVSELQRRGIATAAIAQLCRRAWDEGVAAIVSHTLPSLLASQGVLTKSGFRRVEVLHDPQDGEVWRYQYSRP